MSIAHFKKPGVAGYISVEAIFESLLNTKQWVDREADIDCG